MIGIIDYNAGNIASVALALKSLGLEFHISKKPADLHDAERIIFPGVGHAKFAMRELIASGFDEFLRTFAASGRPVLGICLGSQIIFTHSDEGNTECINLITGDIRHFDTVFASAQVMPQTTKQLKIPHMGWNDISFTESPQSAPCPLLKGIPNHTSFYFVHSYMIQPQDSAVIAATADYGVSVPAIIQKDTIFAVQFHPEKSAQNGLRLLQNFSEVRSC